MFLLIRKMLANSSDTADTELRRRMGVISGSVGILLNLLLFAGKLSAALLSGSVSVIADAFNNLSDAGSSIITMVGFKLSGKKPDPEHPFGHGRFEYITGFIVSVAIILMGFELIVSSVRSIIEGGTELDFSSFTVVILSASIAVKLYMFAYNRKLGRAFSSAAMKATAADSLSDAVATSAVLAALLISHYTNLHLDSYMGIVVSLFILYSGVSSAKETLEPLLGGPPDKELVKAVEGIVREYRPTIVGMHDLVVHDYGPGRLMLSLHAEVPSSINVFAAHSLIDDLENELGRRLGCEAVIHFDPIDTGDEELKRLKGIVCSVVEEIDGRMSIHDLRYVPGDSHTNLIFDVVVPYSIQIKDEDLKAKISEGVAAKLPNHFCVIKLDRPQST